MCSACPGPPSGGEWCQLHHCDGAQHGREVYPTETDGAHCGAGPAGEQSADRCGGYLVILCCVHGNLFLLPSSLLPSLHPSVFPSTIHSSSCCLLPNPPRSILSTPSSFFSFFNSHIHRAATFLPNPALSLPWTGYSQDLVPQIESCQERVPSMLS